MKKNILLCLIIFAVQVSKSGNPNYSSKILNDKDVFGTRVFIENKGQYDGKIPSQDKINFVLDNGFEKIYFTDKGVVYQLTKEFPLTERQLEQMEKGKPGNLKKPEEYYITMNWINANPGISIETSEKQSHYFTYGPAQYNSSTLKK